MCSWFTVKEKAQQSSNKLLTSEIQSSVNHQDRSALCSMVTPDWTKQRGTVKSVSKVKLWHKSTMGILLVDLDPNVNKCTNQLVCRARRLRHCWDLRNICCLISCSALQSSDINFMHICDLCLLLSTVDAPTLDCKTVLSFYTWRLMLHIVIWFSSDVLWFPQVCVAHWRHHKASERSERTPLTWVVLFIALVCCHNKIWEFARHYFNFSTNQHKQMSRSSGLCPYSSLSASSSFCSQFLWKKCFISHDKQSLFTYYWTFSSPCRMDCLITYKQRSHGCLFTRCILGMLPPFPQNEYQITSFFQETSWYLVRICRLIK